MKLRSLDWPGGAARLERFVYTAAYCANPSNFHSPGDFINVLATTAWILAAIAALIGVYYLVPNVYHVLAEPDPMQMHVKHAIAFFAVGVVLLLGGRFLRNSQA